MCKYRVGVNHRSFVPRIRASLGEERVVEQNLEPTQVVLCGNLVGKPSQIALGGGDVSSRCINAELNLGDTILVGNKRIFPLKFSLNSNGSAYGKGVDLRNSCWTGKGLTMKMSEEGMRRVECDCNKGGPKDFKWVTRGTKQAEDKPVVGLGASPLLTNPHVGPLNLDFSGPSLYEVGESSLAGLGILVHPSVTVARPKALL